MDTTKKIVGAAVLAVVVLLAALFIGGSYWSGKNIEQKFRDGMKEIGKYGVKVTVTDYQRGVFGATARTELALVTMGEESTTFAVINYRIQHGPLLTMGPLAIINSELTPAEKFTAMFQEFLGSNPFEGKALLTGKTIFAWSGEVSSLITSPKLSVTGKESQAMFSWDGMTGEIAVSDKGTKLKSKFEMGGLSAVSGKNHFEIGAVTSRDDRTKIEGYKILYDGTSNIVMDKILIRGEEDAGEIRGFSAENVRADSSMGVNDGVLAIKIRFDADAVVVESKTKTAIDNPGATFLYENIDAQAFDAVCAVVYDTTAEKRQQEAFSALQEYGEALLRRQPAFSIKDMTMRWPEGAVTGDFRIAYAGSGNLGQIFSDLSVDLQLRLPRALIVRLMEEQVPESFGEEAKTAMINVIIQTVFLAENDDTLALDARFSKGRLLLNGEEKSPEALQGLFRGAPKGANH
jgi:uncharacterized protein YdgA (DUF945 family)